MDWILTPTRVGAALALLTGYIALCAGLAWRSAQQRRLAQQEQRSLQQADAGQGGPQVLVVYASQTGQAEALARDTAHTLHTGGCSVRLLPLQAVTHSDLQAHSHSLWLLSTTGEGDAPDHALPFVQKMQAHVDSLPGHAARVLALGDKAYTQFCAFGLRVGDWLQAQGVHTEVVCMDGVAAPALAQWQSGVGAVLHTLTGQAAPAWQAADARLPWVLQRRTHLNPGSQGGAVYLLEWRPKDGGALPHWESGDLVSLCPPADPQGPRDYTIASVPEEGCLQLLVRQSVRADGSPGLASDWLCAGMAEGDSLDLRIRAHSSFRLGDNATRPLVLIGNGTGLAGLYAHTKARIAQQQFDQWLLFGERSPVHDQLLDAQLQQWLAQGQLAQLDRAWSRDVQAPSYVQQVLAQQAPELRRWLERGAAIYVCGSLQGMAQGVDDTLRAILGDAQVDALAASGRYRRDVY